MSPSQPTYILVQAVDGRQFVIEESVLKACEIPVPPGAGCAEETTRAPASKSREIKSDAAGIPGESRAAAEPKPNRRRHRNRNKPGK